MSELIAKIGADTSGLKQAIQNAKDMLEQYKNSEKSVQEEIKKTKGVTEEQINAFSRVTKALDKVKSGTMSTTQQQKALQTQLRELKIQWDNLSDEAKKGDFGKAISQQTQAARAELNKLNTQLKETKVHFNNSGSGSKQFADKLKTLNNSFNKSNLSIGGMISNLSTLGAPAMGMFAVAAGGAYLFGEALSKTQTIQDTTTEYTNAFNDVLSTLGSRLVNLDFGHLLDGLGEIIKKSREATQAIDALQTFQAFSEVDFAELQNKKVQLELEIKTAKKNGKPTEELEKQLEEVDKLIEKQYREISKKAKNAYEKGINELYSSVGAETKEQKEAVNRVIEDAFAFDDLDNQIYQLQKVYNDWQRIYSWKTDKNTPDAKNAKEQMDAALRNLNVAKNLKEQEDKILEIRKARLTAAQAETSANRELIRSLKLESGGGGGKDNKKKVKELKNSFETELKNGNYEVAKNLLTQIEKIAPDAAKALKEQLISKVQLKFELDKYDADKLAEEANDYFAKAKRIAVPVQFDEFYEGEEGEAAITQNEIVIRQWKQKQEEIKKTQKEIKKTNELYNSLGDLIGSIGSAFSSMGDDGAQSFLNIIQSAIPLISVLSQLSIAQGVQKATSSSKNYIELIAAVAATVAAIGTALSQKDKYANGGIVGGTTTIGDYNLARVNKGEMILNSRQQQKLFNMLNGNGGINNNNVSNGQVTFKIKGQELVGVLNNYNKKISKL